jgi:outer membrane protein assembly factor BamB
LDSEQQGERALICLQAADGKQLWKTPMKYNPWAGPVVAGNIVVIAGSSIRLDPNQIAGANGEVAALDLQTGAILWRRDIPGGVVSRCTVRDNLVIFTATDGKVRAFDLRHGDRVWLYDAGAPLLAGAVIAGDMVYTADLKSVVHALSLADGARRWTFDLANDPAVQTAGMVYGTPLARDGRLYVATCNLTNAASRRTGAVVCLGEK